jgi:hypothetical protein
VTEEKEGKPPAENAGRLRAFSSETESGSRKKKRRNKNREPARLFGRRSFYARIQAMDAADPDRFPDFHPHGSARLERHSIGASGR